MDNQILKAITNNGSNKMRLQEQQAIQDWREQSMDNELLFSFLNDVDHYQNDLKQYKHFEVKESHTSMARRRFVVWILLVGIFIVSVATAIYSLPSMNKNTAIKFALLNDQSKIQLYGNSNIKISENFGKDNRELSLVGKAFFDVAHNPEIPFVIITNSGKITVKGTSFIIEEIGDKLKVHVRNGIVEFSNSNYSKVLKRGEYAEFFPKRFEIVDARKLKATLITESYRKTSVSDLLTSLVDKYDINLVMNYEDELKSCLFNGNFENASVFDILEELKIMFKLDFYLQDGVIFIGNVKCN